MFLTLLIAHNLIEDEEQHKERQIALYDAKHALVLDNRCREGKVAYSEMEGTCVKEGLRDMIIFFLVRL